jgi:hypothetical protein
MTILTVKVQYTCFTCALTDRTVSVREREPSEDVVAWVEFVRREVARDHLRVSPRCVSRHCDLKIPLPHGTDRIGAADRH